MRKAIYLSVAILLAITVATLLTAQSKSDSVRVGPTDLGGTVTSSNGPEAYPRPHQPMTTRPPSP